MADNETRGRNVSRRVKITRKSFVILIDNCALTVELVFAFSAVFGELNDAASRRGRSPCNVRSDRISFFSVARNSHRNRKSVTLARPWRLDSGDPNADGDGRLE